ncbi:MAG: acyl-CoA carboxylase subunit epsilon [Leifsonia sp.]
MGRHSATETETDEAGERAGAVDIVFVTRNVTAEESAAVTAVVSGLLQEESAQARLAPEAGQSAWQRSQRSVRGRIDQGPGRRRSFSG